MINFNYRLIKNSTFSIGYYYRERQDQMEPMMFNYNERSIRLNLNNRFDHFGIELMGEYGKTDNLLLDKKDRLDDLFRSRITLNCQISKKFNMGGFICYQQNNRYLLNNYKSWIYGINANGAISKKLSLSINYQNTYNIEEYNYDRSLLDGRITYSPNKNNRFEILGRYHLTKNSMDVKQITIEARYTHNFNVPISKKKNLGKLSGRVINKGVKTIEGIVLSIGSDQALTDKNGNYYFPMLPAGNYYLMIDYSKAGVFAVPETPGPYQIEILPRGATKFDIALTQSAKITGEVSILKEVSDEDKSYAGIRERLGKLLVEAKNGSEVYRNFTKDNGEFSFESLRPGQWSVRVYQAGIPKEYELVTDQFNVGLASGQSEHIEVKVKEVRRRIKFQTFINTTPPSANQPAKTGAPSGKTGASNGTSKSKPISKSVVKPQGKPIVSDTTRIKQSLKQVSLNVHDPKDASEAVEYRVQIGAYEQPLGSTTELAEKLKITDKIVEGFFNGKYIYTIGSYKSQLEATVRNEAIKKSTTTIIPFVVSFRNGVRTPKMEKTQLAVK